MKRGWPFGSRSPRRKNGRRSTDSFNDRAAEVLAAIEGGVFPPRIGWHCQDCPVRSRCLGGSGPPLVLVHGSFSDHVTNWREVKPLLQDHFTVYAVARRGRGETSRTRGHSVDDEAGDIVAVLDAVGQPAFLLGHSYGAVCALGAAAQHPGGVRKLVLYEHPDPARMTPSALAALERMAERADWDQLVDAFMRDLLQVPVGEVTAIKATPFWPVWTADAEASMHDVRALSRHRFEADHYRSLTRSVQLLIGTESRREIYVTDALAAVLPDVRITELDGQAHEGMTRAPREDTTCCLAWAPDAHHTLGRTEYRSRASHACALTVQSGQG